MSKFACFSVWKTVLNTETKLLCMHFAAIICSIMVSLVYLVLQSSVCCSPVDDFTWFGLFLWLVDWLFFVILCSGFFMAYWRSLYSNLPLSLCPLVCLVLDLTCVWNQFVWKHRYLKFVLKYCTILTTFCSFMFYKSSILS